jgi:hypothetical protein
MYIPHTSVMPQYHFQGPYPKPTTFTPKGPMTFYNQVHMTLQHPLPSHGYLFMGDLVLGGLVL